MAARIKKILEQTLVRYVVIGGTAYAIELSFLLSFIHFAHFSRTIATALAYWVGLFITFFLQKIIAFRDYNKEKKTLGRQGAIYGILVAFNYCFTIFVVSKFSADDVIWSRTGALVAMTCWNYIIYKKYIFKDNVQNPV